MNSVVSQTNALCAALSEAMNQALLERCRALPAAIQTRSVLFLVEDSGLTWPGPFNYFHRYYPVSYSGLVWMNRHAPRPLADADPARAAAIEALATSMALHRIDDHIVDGDLTLSHMLLQLRTELWSGFARACEQITHDGEDMRRDFLDRYFATIDDMQPADSFAGFRKRFTGQMATWTLGLLLFARAAGYPAATIQRARLLYEAFGVAWRYIDDLADWRTDAVRGANASAVYLILNPDSRTLWHRCHRENSSQKDSADAGAPNTLDALEQTLAGDGVLTELYNHAQRELFAAVGHALDLGWPEVARDLDEVRSIWSSRYA